MLFSFHRLVRASSIGCLSLVLATRPVGAQFSFNGGTAGTVVPSIANQSCGTGAAIGGGGMGGMGGGGNCDGTNFLQEVTNIGGAEYYHIVVGSGANFAIEYYIRTVAGGVCWFGCAGARVIGMGGMAGGGVAPLSASSGSATNDSAPLASSNSGTGRPDQAAIRMVVSDGQMSQEFLKATETNKPRITQTVSTADTTINFAIDMSSINYTDASRAGTLTLRQTVNSPNFPPAQSIPNTNITLPNSASFDIAQALNNTSVRTVNGSRQITQTPNDRTNAVTGGRFTYTPGAGDGGSLGAYAYFRDSFDVYNINWASFCDPAQNPVSNCVNYGGVRGGMGAAGAAAGGGAMGGTATGGGATTGGATGGTTTGGGMSGGGTTTTTTTTSTTTTTRLGTTTTILGTTSTTTRSTTTTTTSTSTTTTTVVGGGMGGGM